MTDHYSIAINSEKITPEIAANFLLTLKNYGDIESFQFHPNRLLTYMKGIPTNIDMLKALGFSQDEIVIDQGEN